MDIVPYAASPRIVIDLNNVSYSCICGVKCGEANSKYEFGVDAALVVGATTPGFAQTYVLTIPSANIVGIWSVEVKTDYGVGLEPLRFRVQPPENSLLL